LLPQATALRGRLIDSINDINAPFDYKLVPTGDVHSSFVTAEGLQFRTDRNLNNIRNIRDDFNAQEHFSPRGGYEGVPLISRSGDVAIGNHRAQAIKEMSADQYAAYLDGMRENFPEAYAAYERVRDCATSYAPALLAE
jgi:hypothetical protein